MRRIAWPVTLGVVIAGLGSGVADDSEDGLVPPPELIRRPPSPTGKTGQPRTEPSSNRGATPSQPTPTGRTAEPSQPAPTGRTAQPSQPAPTGRTGGGEIVGISRALGGEEFAPVEGWTLARAPNGKLLGYDLAKHDEDDLLRDGDDPALYAVGRNGQDYHPEREPLILIHGIRGEPANLQAVLDRFKDDPRYQVYVLCYDDFHMRTGENGVGLARELRALSDKLGPGRDVTIVAHSLGGIVARRALNDLAQGEDKGIERFGRVRLVAVDTPWHGYGGPSDRGLAGVFMDFGRIFMPAGLEDMRVNSDLFQGDPDAKDEAAKKGLLDTPLPGNVEVDLVFAKEGDQVQDYTEEPLDELRRKYRDHFLVGRKVEGTRALEAYDKALRSSRQWGPFAAEATQLARQGRLTNIEVLRLLTKHFPRFEGDHGGVLKDRRGEGSLNDYLVERLSR